MNPRPTDTTKGAPATPKTKARLEALVTQWRKDSGQPVARLNLRIAAMMLAGALARVLDPDGHAIFATKGGIAMELRMGERARTTRDIDLVLRTDPDTLAELLQQGLAEPYRAFTFRHGAITELPPRPQVKQVKIQVSFAGKILCSPKLEDRANRDRTRGVHPAPRHGPAPPSACKARRSCSYSPSLGKSRKSCTLSPRSQPAARKTYATGTSSTCNSCRR